MFYRIFWESTKFEGIADLKEPWYGTAYSIERLTGSTTEVDLNSLFMMNTVISYYLNLSRLLHLRYSNMLNC